MKKLMMAPSVAPSARAVATDRLGRLPVSIRHTSLAHGSALRHFRGGGREEEARGKQREKKSNGR